MPQMLVLYSLVIAQKINIDLLPSPVTMPLLQINNTKNMAHYKGISHEVN